MGVIERKEREKNGMKRLILDTAINLFLDHGFENVSMRKIAEKIEYSPATIYSYFKDKGDILFSLLEEGFGIMKSKQDEVQFINPPKERLVAHGLAYLNFAFDYPHYYDIMFIMNYQNDDNDFIKHWDCGDRSFEILIKNIIECQEVGYFKNEEPRVIGMFVWSIVHGFASLIIRRKKALKELSPQYFEFLTESILSQIRKIIV